MLGRALQSSTDLRPCAASSLQLKQDGLQMSEARASSTYSVAGVLEATDHKTSEEGSSQRPRRTAGQQGHSVGPRVKKLGVH